MSAKELELDRIVEVLERNTQRATYGAVGGLIGRPARSLMLGRDKNPRNCWVVATDSHMPSGYSQGQMHPLLTARDMVLSTTEDLAAWLKEYE